MIQELESIPLHRIREMQSIIGFYGHTLQYAIDDYPNDAIETMLKGSGYNQIILYIYMYTDRYTYLIHI